MLQNTRVAAFTVSELRELRRENQHVGLVKLPSPPSQIRIKVSINYTDKLWKHFPILELKSHKTNSINDA